MAINAFQIKYKNTMAVNIEIGADFRSFFEKVAEAEAKFKAVGTAMQKVGLGMSVAVSAPLTLIAREAIKANGELSKIDEGLGQIRDVAMKELGKAIIEAFNLKDNMLKFRVFLEKLVTAFQNLNPVVKKWGVYIGAVAVAAGPLLIALGTFVNLIPVLSAGLALLTGPIGLVIAAIMALGVAFIYIKYNLQAFKDFFGNIWIRIKNGFIDTIKVMLFAYKKLADILGLDIGKDVFNWLDKQKGVIKENTAAFKSFGDTFREVATDVKAKLFTGNSLFKIPISAEQTKQSLTEGIVMPVTEVVGTLRSIIPQMAQWGIDMGDAAGIGLIKGLQVPIAKITQFTQEMNMLITDALSSAAVSFAENIGKLAAGGGAKDVGKGLLLSIADFAGRLGRYLILTGIGIEAFKESIKSLNGPVAVVAGIALVAAATAVKATLSGGLDGGGGGSYSGGGGGNFSGVQYNPQPIVLETRIQGRELILVQDRSRQFRR
jgi:hypothetical protein